MSAVVNAGAAKPAFNEKYTLHRVLESATTDGSKGAEKPRLQATFVTPQKAEFDQLGSSRTIKLPGTLGKDVCVLEPKGHLSFGSAMEVKSCKGDGHPNDLKIPVLNFPVRGEPGIQDSYLQFGPDVEVVMVTGSPDVQALPNKEKVKKEPGKYYGTNDVKYSTREDYGTDDHPNVALYLRTADGKIIRSNLERYPACLDILKKMEAARKIDQETEAIANVIVQPDN